MSSVTADLDKVEASAISSVGLDFSDLSVLTTYPFLVTQAAQSLLKGKPTYVVVGDVNELPYADEVGL